MNNELKIRRDKSIFTGVLLGFLIVVIIALGSCSPTLKVKQTHPPRYEIKRNWK